MRAAVRSRQRSRRSRERSLLPLSPDRARLSGSPSSAVGQDRFSLRTGLIEVAGYKPPTPIAVSCAFLSINERYLYSRLTDFDEVPIRVADVGADLEAMVL